MKDLTFNMIVAACAKRGIGLNGDLPWSLPKELNYFSTTTKQKHDSAKQNVVIMGRKTFFSIPPKVRPLRERLNIVLTSNPKQYEFPESVLVFTNFNDVFKHLEKPDVRSGIENIWVIGGSVVYEEGIKSNRCSKIYYTDIQHDFNCDTFFPEIPPRFIDVTKDKDAVQEENGIKYRYLIYQNNEV